MGDDNMNRNQIIQMQANIALLKKKLAELKEVVDKHIAKCKVAKAPKEIVSSIKKGKK